MPAVAHVTSGGLLDTSLFNVAGKIAGTKSSSSVESLFIGEEKIQPGPCGGQLYGESCVALFSLRGPVRTLFPSPDVMSVSVTALMYNLQQFRIAKVSLEYPSLMNDSIMKE
eukprot:6781490-Ditylum_brightwellii.AAC.1